MIEIGAALVTAFCLGSAFGRWLQACVVQAQVEKIAALDGRLREVSHESQRFQSMIEHANCAMDAMRQVNLTTASQANVVMERYADAYNRLSPHLARAHEAQFQATYSARVH